MSFIVSVQTDDPKKATYLRGVVEDGSRDAILAKVVEMLDHPAAFNLSSVKPKKTFPGRRKKTLPVLTGDEDVIPGVEATVSAALDRT